MKFCVKEFLFVNLDFEKGCKNEFEDHAADSKIGSPLEIDFRADWTHESNPTA